jgi:hypothetical protein
LSAEDAVAKFKELFEIGVEKIIIRDEVDPDKLHEIIQILQKEQ